MYMLRFNQELVLSEINVTHIFFLFNPNTVFYTFYNLYRANLAQTELV